MEYFDLTTPQQNIWNLQKYYEDTAITNLCGVIFYNEKRNSSLLQQAICQFIQNQSGMRLRFCEEGEPKQYVSDEIDKEIPVITFASMEEFNCYAEGFAKEPIGLIERKMYRFVVIQIEGKSGILVTLSHLISDAWTFGLMANQLESAYRILAEESGNVLVKGDYIDYIKAENDYLVSSRYEKDKCYWEEKYAVRPEKNPIKLCPALTDTVTARRITRSLPYGLEEKIAVYCNRYPVTQAVLFETALVIYLSKINPKSQTVTIGVPVLNRSNAKEKDIAGMFVSTMPLTVTITENMAVLELAKQITKEHMNLFRHQKYPYADILKSLREKQNFSGNLYDVMISYQNAKTKTGADTKWYSNGCSEVPFIIHIDNRDEHESHTINVDYQTAVFGDEKEVKYIVDRLEYILEQIVEDKVAQIRDIGIVPKQELEKTVYEFNDTYVNYPREKCVHELFTEQAKRTPDRIALVFGEKKFTYRELDEMSNSLAHFLRKKGVVKGDKIAALLKRNEWVIFTQLAVIKVGAVFIPIDNRYPQERIKYIMEESDAKLILKNIDEQKMFVNSYNVEEIDLSANENYKNARADLEDICYAIFTSGSTGKPKGCTLTHMGIVNFCTNINILKYCNQLNNKICISVNTISFDMFILESLFPLLNGYTVVMANEEQSTNRGQFIKLINDSHANIIQTTPTRYQMYFDQMEDNSYAKQFDIIASSGEPLPLGLLNSFLINTNAKIFNPMGPSECTIYAMGGELHIHAKEAKQADITLGKPIANTQIYILDADNNPMPIGVAGELCIAGDGVGKGYLNRPELTAEKFVSNPFATEENHHGKTMYRTGDLARWRADGEIEYLGRIDTQVKIRGLRIELGEIESVMGGMEGIGLVAVADKRDADGRQYLAGYYTVETEIDEKKLRHRLAEKLPKYMIPNYFMHLDVMPMTPSGKIDRKNLPEADVASQKREYTEPVTETEKMLSQIWQRLLHIGQAGRTDDFFELGGDSLLAISMLNEIEKEFRVEISVKDIMENSLLEQLAQCIEQAHEISPIIPYHEKKYVLMPQQKAIYAVCSKNPDALTYNMPARVEIPDNIDRNKLKQSVIRVLNSHKLLKSYIKAEEDEIYGFYDEEAKIVVEEYQKGEEMDFVRPFDLGKAPLVRVGFTEDAILFDMHHIAADGDSMEIILHDIVTEYEGKTLREHKAEYSDYASYFYKLDTAEHKAYFKEMLKCDFEPVLLPQTKHIRHGGASRFYHISEKAFSMAKKFARENGLTDTMVFLGAYGILLSKYTGKKDVLSSIVLQNRVHADTREMVGMFVNTLPVHLAVKGSLSEYMQEIKRLLLNLFRYQELPFWDIAGTVGMSDKTAVNNSFVYQGDGEKTLILDGEKLVPEFIDTHTSKFDFSMELTPVENGCRMRMEYDLAKFDEKLMDDLADAYIRILEQINREKVADISVLSKDEYHKVVETFNDTYVDYPREKCVHELFTEQAKRTPDQVALVFEEKKFTYRELDEMSNSLAHFLREKGVRRNDVVPIIAKRSWHVIVAMLGVMKAGGAYLPVNPDYPVDRIAYIMDITKCKIVLLHSMEIDINVDSIQLSQLNYTRNKSTIENINHKDDLAYIIFTSGSTGMPKGIKISHQNLVNFACENNKNYYQNFACKNGAVMLANTVFTFDMSIFEIYMSLLNGLKIVMSNEAQINSATAIADLINKNMIDILHCTPTKMQLLLSDKSFKNALRKIKIIMIGAEEFTNEVYNKISNYTNATIFNGYGPTEITIGASFKKIENNDDITIGKPIANTQIYILDADNNPMPISVAGELCIAGDGVGKGYLNRPELTAEKFVSNPFATEENRHGKIMYRTGDLARWRADGEIEYLGRIDTQVKIRGLRIELGEIENVMGGMEGIGLVAVADRRDADGRQYLAGYYTADAEINETKLRQHLAEKLPKYMIPNYFMRLDVMPMTSSGKIDRKNLPEPDITLQKRVYVEPVTEREKKLCSLVEKLLHVERVGIQDDFFELGGDSLTAIEYMARAHSAEIDFALQNVFDFPTVQSLCDFLDKGKVSKIHYEASDFDKYGEIFARNTVDESFIPQKKPLGNILLTGVTGFLGAHVLDRLMQTEQGKIYCLVRSRNKNDYGKRAHEIIQYYFGNRYDHEIGNRIILIEGDIEREELAEDIPKDVQTVIHTAASVRHYGSYDYFRRINVEGTCHVINYAKSVGAKLIHISTLSVSGNSMADEFTAYRSEEEKYFYETSYYIGQPLDNVYIHSKFEAERAVYDAMLGGLDAKVIRVGNLTSRASDYKFQPNYKENAFLTRVKAVLEFGLFPDYLMPLYSEFSPIDLTAEGVVKIAQYAEKQCIFHLNSNRPIYFERFLEAVRQMGISMKVVDGINFHKALEQTMLDAGTEYIFEALQNDMDEQGRLIYDSNIRIVNDFTVWFLKKVGFEWSETDEEYIRGYLRYFCAIGYLEV